MEWAVQSGDGDFVGDVVARMHKLGAPIDARVYLNGRRAGLEEPVEPGDRIELWPLREAPSGGVRILAQRDGVLLVAKPAGLPAETTHLGEDSVVSAVMTLLNGGRVHAATRLDTAVSGVCVCTLGRDAARRLERWRSTGHLHRTYVAIASAPLEGEGEWDTPLGHKRDRAGRTRAVRDGRDVRPARTRWRAVASTLEATWLELRPETGRMHQLRAHAALAGAPLYGDRLYGGPRNITTLSGKVCGLTRITLHCWRIVLPELEATAPVPAELSELWRSLGGPDV
jgi:23S rRNA-/tRNA-specific pseudouridylate synthase